MSRVLDRKDERSHRDTSMVHSTTRLATIGLCALTLAACGPKNEKAASPLPVTVQTVHTGSGAAGNSYSGSVVADTQVDVAFKVNGYVETILQVKGADGQTRNVQAGDRVNSGVVLASIRDDTYRQTLLRAQADLENARATQTKAKADFGRFSQLFEKKVISPAEFDTVIARKTRRQAGLFARPPRICEERSPKSPAIAFLCTRAPVYLGWTSHAASSNVSNGTTRPSMAAG